jgi:hypothetical protein
MFHLDVMRPLGPPKSSRPWPWARGVFVVAMALGACGEARDAAPPDDSAEDGSGGQGGAAPGGGSGGGGDDLQHDPATGGSNPKDCKRTLKLTSLAVTAPEPFDVVIVADHSGSLSWSKTDLAEGLKNFVDQVRGYDVRFYLLTPTQYGASSAASESPINGQYQVQWQDPVSLAPYEGEMTAYSESCQTSLGQDIACPATISDIVEDYTLRGRWDFRAPLPVGAISASMTDEAFAAQSAAIQNSIVSLGTAGASDEQPLCTLHRYLGQTPTALPEHAVFLVLSDEDDTSDPSRCLREQELNIDAIGETQLFEIRGSGLRSQRRFQCTPVDDHGQVVGAPIDQLWNLGSCTSPRACTSTEEQQSQAECPVNHAMSNCTITCMNTTWISCRIEDAAVSTDACNGPFQYSGQTYANLLDYCQKLRPEVESWGTCTNYLKDGTATQAIRLLPLTEDTSATEMARSVRTKADAAFGREGYAIELIGFDAAFSCVPEAGQSYLSNLKELAASPDNLHPICGDYGSALTDAHNFAGTLIQTDYVLDLAKGDEPDAIVVLSSSGETRVLPKGVYTYDETSRTLHFEPGALFATDASLEIDVLEACVYE